MYKVAVLLSTYNGEKYIRELIDSVLKQRNVEVELYIRDDGSTDDTIRIIQTINDSRINLIIGNENLKPAKSFLTLLSVVGEADYYAFCDQDDVWLEYKLEHAINEIKVQKDIPALYMSTYDVVNQNLELLYKRNMGYENPMTLETTILYRAPSACTMVFNYKLKKILSIKVPNHARMHDFWTLLVALGIGAYIKTEDISLIKYRIHGNNTVGLENSILKRSKRLLKSAIHNKNERMLQAKELYDIYKDVFNEDINEKLIEVINYNNSLRNKIKFISNKEYRGNQYINILFYVSVIMGVF